MNEHTQSGIYDLAQTPSGEIITLERNHSYHLIDLLNEPAQFSQHEGSNVQMFTKSFNLI